MSATIGNEAVFARELGVEEFDFYRTPAVWPAETRPVHVLDVPSMGKGAADKDPGIWNKQADAISKAILNLPRHWSGIILVSRKSEANLLAKRLADRGLQERIWVPPGADAQDYKPTNEQLAAWQERLEEVPNSIAVAWSFWEGVDAKESQILIAAKCLASDMRIFGPDGYKDIDSIKLGDKVFGTTPDGELIEDTVVSIIRKPYTGEMIHFHSKGYDVTVTPDHQMLVTHIKKDSPYEKIDAEAVNTSHMLPLRATSWNGESLPDQFTFEEFFDEKTIVYCQLLDFNTNKTWYNQLPSPFVFEYRYKLFKIKWTDYAALPSSIQQRTKPVWYCDGAQSNKLPYSIDKRTLLELAGWFVSEGHSQNLKEYCYENGNRAGQTWRIAFTQNKGQGLDAIRNLLLNAGIQFSEHEKTERCARLTIHSKVLYRAFTEWFGVGAKNKKIPRFILNSSSDDLRVMFDALIAGDGIVLPTGKSYSYQTTSLSLREAMIEIGLKLGFGARFRPVQSGCWLISFPSFMLKGTINQENKTRIPYDGEVWCVTTKKTGTILVEHDGKHTFVGNCPFAFRGSAYEMARERYDGAFALQRVAWQLEQGLGRVRRGDASDYDDPARGIIRTYVAIADGSWTRIKKYLSSSMLESLVID